MATGMGVALWVNEAELCGRATGKIRKLVEAVGVV